VQYIQQFLHKDRLTELIKKHCWCLWHHAMYSDRNCQHLGGTWNIPFQAMRKSNHIG